MASAIVLVAATLASMTGAQQPKKCYDCKGTGLKDCPARECKADRVCGVKWEHKCDAIYSAKCCRGYGKILCPKCKDPVVAVEIEEEMEARKAWLDSVQKVETGCGTRFTHVETEHWLLRCSLPTWKVGETTYTRVKAAHLWAQRLDDTADLCKEKLGNYTKNKMRANIVATADEAMRTTLTIQGVGHTQPYKTFSHEGIFTTRPHEEFVTDPLLHPHVVHTATHILLHATYKWPQEFSPWFHEAFAHWVEIERFKEQRTFCHTEVVNAKDPWKLLNWKKQIYGEVAAKRDEPLAAIMMRDTDRLTARDKAHGWSFVEFMLKTRPKEFQKFFETLKEGDGKDTKKALDVAFGWSTTSFQEKWREYVLKAYAP